MFSLQVSFRPVYIFLPLQKVKPDKKVILDNFKVKKKPLKKNKN